MPYSLVAKRLGVREVTLIAIQKITQRLIIQSDSQLVANSVSRKIREPKNIINLVEDVNHLLARFSENRLEYCNRKTNRDTDISQNGSFIILLFIFYLCK